MKKLFILAILISSCASTQNPIRPIGTGNTPRVDTGTAPTNPSNPSPSDNSTGINISGTITWGGCAGSGVTITTKGPDATNNPPTTPSNTPVTNSLAYSGLANSTLYRVRISCSNSFGASTNLDFSFTTTAGSPAGVLSVSNFGTPACFLIYGVDTGNFTTSYPIAMLVVSGVRHYFQISGNGHLYESAEPVLLPCDTPVGSLNVSTFVRDWGFISVNGGDQANIPGGAGGGTYFRGIYIDPSETSNGDHVAYVNWSGAYTNLPTNQNTFARIRLNSIGTLTTIGCYAYPDYMPVTGLGTIRIPANFVASNLSSGYNHALLGGLLASATSGNVYGPSLIAIKDSDLADNACGASNNLISSGIILAQYAKGGNISGPTCGCDGCAIPPPTGFGFGCDTSAKAITNPQPAWLSFTNYSYFLYPQTWDPKNSHGWYGDYTAWFHTWYNDGVLDAVVSPFTQPSGYISSTISSTTGVGQVIPASIDTHDGYHINVGDWFTIQTCIPGTDSNCSTENANHLSVGIVDTLNTGTREITYHVTSSDSCVSCSHIPVVGGPFNLGPHYKSSIPGWPRSVLRIQTYNTAQYVLVIGGSPTYSPVYTEEASMYNMGITTLGEPQAGHGIQGATPNGQAQSQTVVSTIADPSEQKIITFVGNAQTSIVPRALGIVIPVIH